MTLSLVIFVTFAAASSRGAVSFQAAPGSPMSLGSAPTDLVLADLDADGRLDIAAATRGGIAVLTGDGKGGFRAAPGSPLPVSAAPHLLAAADLDRDGRLDLLATSHDTHAVAIWFSAGGGRFVPAAGAPVHALPEGRAHNHGLAAGDLDGDGWIDVTTADDVANVIAVLRGGFDGLRPRPAPAIAVGKGPYPHALGDLDRDGRLDAVVPNTQSDDVTVLLGDGRGGFKPAAGSPVSVTARPYFVALGDVDGSGTLDAVVTHDDTSIVSVLLGDGRGRLAPRPGPTLDAGRRPWKAAIGDLDRDGHPDVALAAGGKVVLLAGDGRGGFRPFPRSPVTVGRGAWSLALGDLDGDGRLDIVTTDLEDGTLTVLLAR